MKRRFALLLLAGCGPSGEKPVVPVVEDAQAHLFRIGSVWQESGVEEGFLENDPKGVAFYHVTFKVRVELAKDGTAKKGIERDERFRMKSGAEFHCVVKGAIGGRAHYLREGDEVRMLLESVAGSLPRSCTEPGFTVPTKEIPEVTVLFALRSDELVAIQPATSRDKLVPVQ